MMWPRKLDKCRDSNVALAQQVRNPREVRAIEQEENARTRGVDVDHVREPAIASEQNSQLAAGTVGHPTGDSDGLAGVWSPRGTREARQSTRIIENPKAPSDPPGGEPARVPAGAGRGVSPVGTREESAASADPDGADPVLDGGDL